MRLITIIATMAILGLTSCSQAPITVDSKYDLSPGKDSCKNFPVTIYPNTTSKICEKHEQYENTPINYTAYVVSKDSVAKVTKFYKNEMPKSGWKIESVKGDGTTHSVVTLRKGIAYASVAISVGKNKKGSSFQIQAYPFGN